MTPQALRPRPALLALSLLALVVGACGGGDDDAAPPPTERVAEAEGCTLADPAANGAVLICRRPAAGDRGHFEFGDRGRIPIEYPYEAPAGHWSGAYVSPDARRLLLQWTAECEVPYAFVVPVTGGRPRLALGEQEIETARATVAHGWTRNGEAIIEVVPTCGDAGRTPPTQLWLVSPDGSRRRLR